MYEITVLDAALVHLIAGFKLMTSNVCLTDTNCTDKPVFTPPRLTVKYGDPTSASCSVCQQACKDKLKGLEKAIGVTTENGTTFSWRVDKVTEWEIPLTCYYNDDPPEHQCCSILLVTAYSK